jgi:hypothetical protein
VLGIEAVPFLGELEAGYLRAKMTGYIQIYSKKVYGMQDAQIPMPENFPPP